MTFNIDLIQKYYHDLPAGIDKLRRLTKRPLTFTEKILFTHLSGKLKDFQRGRDYVEFNPDRIAMQDATGQMALLQFMMADRDNVAVPTTVHCDHLIQAKLGSKADINSARKTNNEVYDFLASVSEKYGIGFWKPGSGIIHIFTQFVGIKLIS